MVRQDRATSNSDNLVSVLSELEEWETFLKAEPEVIHKLREFESTAKDEPVRPPARSGPKMRGPSL